MSDAGQFLSRAERFRLKAVECRQIADSAQLPQSRVIFANLAQSYSRLAMHEERLEAVMRRPAQGIVNYQSRPHHPRPIARKHMPKKGVEVMKAQNGHHPAARVLARAGTVVRLFFSGFNIGRAMEAKSGP